MKHLFNYEWKLADGYPANGIEPNGLNVFGTFICGGGSTMGYKLAGFNHLGGVEIDPKIADVYKINHNPKYLYIEDIRDFVKRDDFPSELYNLDILDGSPPCSTFSIAGNREKDWGKEKMFAEGQKKQRLDDLFFEYIKLAERLQPKVVIAENVKGLIKANAKIYVKHIFSKFALAGYTTQLFLLNSATMGVPQKRERVFFIARRANLHLPDIQLNYFEKPILFKEISDNTDVTKKATPLFEKYWKRAEQGKSVGTFLSVRKIHKEKPSNTIVSTKRHWSPYFIREINNKEIIKAQSFPSDYNFNNADVNYLCGMSVPPIMTAQIANQIYLQWFKNEQKN